MSREPTREQQLVLERRGNFVVRACPGSGKTYTVAAKFAEMANNWERPHAGIACLSFTNVAWREIEDYLKNDFEAGHLVNRYPHFLGTIDSFINQHVFLRFGHKVLGIQERPILTGPPHDDSDPIGVWLWWRERECFKNCRLHDFTYDVNGQFTVLSKPSHFGKCQLGHARCRDLKRSFHKAGFATQADANYFTLKILRDYPSIARSLARRFPVWFVDEAQDTSAMQMAIIDILLSHGLEEIMLVGDPDQAIYEWRNAEPRVFTAKFNEWKDDSIELVDNWRSTQEICDFAGLLSSSGAVMNSSGEYSEEQRLPPLIWEYEDDEACGGLVEDFSNMTVALGLEPALCGVLARGKNTVKELSPASGSFSAVTPWSTTGETVPGRLAKAKYLFDTGAYADAIKLAGYVVGEVKANGGERSQKAARRLADQKGTAVWRTELLQLLRGLPSTDMTLAAWAEEANGSTVLRKWFGDTEFKVKRGSPRKPAGAPRHGDMSFHQVYGQPEAQTGQPYNCFFSTVHAVKGRTLDAVLMFLKKKAAGGKYYRTLLGANILEEEELRILYVALTRPRYLLVLAVPNGEKQHWEEFFGGNVEQR